MTATSVIRALYHPSCCIRVGQPLFTIERRSTHKNTIARTSSPTGICPTKETVNAQRKPDTTQSAAGRTVLRAATGRVASPSMAVVRFISKGVWAGPAGPGAAGSGGAPRLAGRGRSCQGRDASGGSSGPVQVKDRPVAPLGREAFDREGAVVARADARAVAREPPADCGRAARDVLRREGPDMGEARPADVGHAHAGRGHDGQVAGHGLEEHKGPARLVARRDNEPVDRVVEAARVVDVVEDPQALPDAQAPGELKEVPLPLSPSEVKEDEVGILAADGRDPRIGGLRILLPAHT